MLMPKPHTSNNLHIKSFSAHLKKNKKNSTLKNLKKRSEAEKTLPASYRIETLDCKKTISQTFPSTFMPENSPTNIEFLNINKRKKNNCASGFGPARRENSDYSKHLNNRELLENELDCICIFQFIHFNLFQGSCQADCRNCVTDLDNVHCCRREEWREGGKRRRELLKLFPFLGRRI